MYSTQGSREIGVLRRARRKCVVVECSVVVESSAVAESTAVVESSLFLDPTVSSIQHFCGIQPRRLLYSIAVFRSQLFNYCNQPITVTALFALRINNVKNKNEL